ncbi:MAG TPA: amidohydrolase family protein [Actinomycetota bacterium]|nr:amidohydrolase family protein [Actinomycetota bacterium]
MRRAVSTYVANVTVFDGRGVRRRAGVLVSDRRVEWVGPHTRAPRAARAADELDGTGKTLTPGLIDVHVHLCFDGSADFAREARETASDAAAAVKAVRNAAATLEHGVTTVRDLGGRGDAAIQVGRAVEQGRIPGPRILAAGRALTATGGHGHNVGFAREVDGPDAVRRAVREEVKAGATAIKVIATGGVLTPGIAAELTSFTPEELEAVVDEAHAWGRGVAAHAIGPEGIVRAARAGVDSIEHGSMLDARGARLLKERGTFHVPTISAIRGIVEHPDEVPAYALEKANALAEAARVAFRRSIRAGVRIACGTDAGTPFNPHGNTPVEITRMAEWGLAPIDAMRAATSNAAALLRRPELGRIAPEAPADLVLFDQDPLEEIDVVRKPALVMKGGEIVAGPASAS